MPKELVPDSLWKRIAPLLPPHAQRPKGGRPPADDRDCLRGILFVLRTGVGFEFLPWEAFHVSGMTCWRRLRDWGEAGVLEALQQALLDELGEKGRLDWSRATLDSASVRARGAGALSGRNPTDRGKSGSKHHVVTDRKGRPLAQSLTPANTHDAKEALVLVDEVKPTKTKKGGRKKRPQKLHGDKGYDSKRIRQGLRERGITPRIARKGIESNQKLGRHRWVAERTLSWLHQFKRLLVRFEVRDDIHFHLLQLGASLILLKSLTG